MTTYLSHTGKKGMHWDQRNYQNPDGTWTEAGKAKRRAEYKATHGTSNKPKSSQSNSSEVSEKKKTFVARIADRKAEKAKAAEEEAKAKAAEESKRRAEEDKELDRQLEEERAKKEEYRRQQLEVIEQMKLDTNFYNAKNEALKAQVGYNTTVAALHPKKVSFGQRYVSPILGRLANNIVDNVSSSASDSIKKWIDTKLNGEPKVKYDINQTEEFDKDGKYTGRKLTYKYITTNKPKFIP